MIEGFERETHELTEYEISIAELLSGWLKTKNGKKNAVTSTLICKMAKSAGKKLDAPRLRKIINYIRTNNLVYNLIATSNGYYIASDESEARSYLLSLDQRAREIMRVHDALSFQLNETIKPK